MDIRFASSGRLDAIRRVEYIALLLLCIVALLPLQILTSIVAVPLALIALAMVPGRRVAVTGRTVLRASVVTSLQQDALGLRSRWTAVQQSQTFPHRELEQETRVWIALCRNRLRDFPEIAGILNAIQSDTTVEELDAYLQTLCRLRRLLNLSQVLDIQI